jgi:ubiquinone/menaquinone biosynthesis C-methylase UbiE
VQQAVTESAIAVHNQLGGRRQPRRRCHLRLDRQGQRLLGRPTPVLDLSAGGMLVGASDLALGAFEDGRLHLPGSTRPVEVRYQILRQDAGIGFGARFEALKAADRDRLDKYVAHQRTVDQIKRLQAHLGRADLANLKPLGDPAATRRLVERLAGEGSSVRLWADPERAAVSAHLEALAGDHLVLTLDDSLGGGLERFDELLLLVSGAESDYLADTTVVEQGEGRARILLPERLYRPERRADVRDEPHPAGVGRVSAEVDGTPRTWRLLEAGSGGLSVFVPSPEAFELQPGRLLDANVGRADRDRVERASLRVAYRVAFEVEGVDGVRVGMQRLVDRGPLRVDRISFERPRRGLAAKAERAVSRVARAGTEVARRGLKALRLAPDGVGVEIVRFKNRGGESVVTVRNSTPGALPGEPIPVVVIPPAYGRKKEDTSGLALVLVETFAKAGSPLMVVRYDGSRSVGESDRQAGFDDPEYHNTGLTLSHAVEDLLDVFDHLEFDPSFTLGPVAVVSFSLSAVVARRAVAEDGGRRVRCWVAPMGAADTRDVVRNSTGGIDFLGSYRKGAREGYRTVVGHLMDTEGFCGDAWEQGLADLEDARQDMARIPGPVTWICGDYDYWINFNRVADILTVRAPGPREILRVPTGHTVRSSLEALETFKLIADRVGSGLLGRPVDATLPPRSAFRATAKAERARLDPTDFEPGTYWKRYLLGDRENPLGFDVISLTAGYQELLSDQVEVLRPRAGDRIADLGAGTGNPAEALLKGLPARAVPAAELHLVDLVSDALDVAKAKVERAQRGMGVKRARVETHTADLSRAGVEDMLPFGDGSLDRILASLLVSYLPDPEALLRDARRALRPGGRIVVSSMLPDADMSGPLERLLTQIGTAEGDTVGGCSKEEVLTAVRSYINDAAKLLDLACDDVFRFYDGDALKRLLRRAGFTDVRVTRSFGTPSQAVIAVGVRPAH